MVCTPYSFLRKRSGTAELIPKHNVVAADAPPASSEDASSSQPASSTGTLFQDQTIAGEGDQPLNQDVNNDDYYDTLAKKFEDEIRKIQEERQERNRNIVLLKEKRKLLENEVSQMQKRARVEELQKTLHREKSDWQTELLEETALYSSIEELESELRKQKNSVR